MEENVREATKDVYSLVTNRIIELLEQGTIPWRKPWGTAGIPQNLITHRMYGGINLMLLNSLEFSDNLFVTWNQLQTIGGKVIKGEKGTLIIYHTMIEKEVTKDGKTVIEKKPFIRFYKIFNVAQCRNIPDTLLHPDGGSTNVSFMEYESLVERMPDCPKIIHKENKAYYKPSLDVINMPKMKSFESFSSYYGVLFHELIHATGAGKRLARKTVCENPNFGSEMYSIEELIAEIGSCYLKAWTGISMGDLDNSVSYINNWLSVLQKDKRFIVQATSKAQLAVDYILNIHRLEETENRG